MPQLAPPQMCLGLGVSFTSDHVAGGGVGQKTPPKQPPPILRLLGCFLADDAPFGEVPRLLATTGHCLGASPARLTGFSTCFGAPS